MLFAGVFLRETEIFFSLGHEYNRQKSVGKRKSRFHGIGKARTYSFTHNKSVYDYIYAVFFVFIKRGYLFERINFSVYAGSGITVFAGAFDSFFVHALFFSDDGGCYHEFFAIGKRKYFFYYRFRCRHAYFFSAYGAVRYAYSGIEKTKIIVYLRHCSDCRTWISRCGLLIYRYRRGESVYKIYVGFVYLP